MAGVSWFQGPFLNSARDAALKLLFASNNTILYGTDAALTRARSTTGVMAYPRGFWHDPLQGHGPQSSGCVTTSATLSRQLEVVGFLLAISRT